MVVYTVSQLTGQIKLLLEEALPDLWVEGEISQFTHHTSGHRYFTLKDEASQIRCVIWRWQSGWLSFTPQVGMKVLACGKVSVYERGGQYQFYVSELHPAGIGELQLAFERLKAKLEAEGLFDEGRKRPLPDFPQRIGVVTSSTGAAIRDIEDIVGRRFPAAQIVLRPVRVQGEGAAEEITQGIEDLNRYGEVDVLIVGRGGGAPEDLWAFNEEVVVRAIYRSKVPVISAVGHETDVTIADLVADRRAPTPSAAAEIVVRDRMELKRSVEGLARRAAEVVWRQIAEGEAGLSRLRSSHGLRRFEERIGQGAQRVDDLADRLPLAFDRAVTAEATRWRQASARLDALSPLSAFRRGFSLCQRLPDGLIVRDSADLAPAGRVRIAFERGRATCVVETVENGELRTPETRRHRERQ